MTDKDLYKIPTNSYITSGYAYSDPVSINYLQVNSSNSTNINAVINTTTGCVIT